LKGTSELCGPGQLPQQTWYRFSIIENVYVFSIHVILPIFTSLRRL